MNPQPGDIWAQDDLFVALVLSVSSMASVLLLYSQVSPESEGTIQKWSIFSSPSTWSELGFKLIHRDEQGA